MQAMTVRHELQSEGYFCGVVLVSDPQLQPDVQVELLVRNVLGPGHLRKAVGLGMVELGVGVPMGVVRGGVTGETH